MIEPFFQSAIVLLMKTQQAPARTEPDDSTDATMTGFAGVAPSFIVKLCERLLAQTAPRHNGQMVFGGVHLSLFVDAHWAGHERYMLIGQDWTVGFNLSLPTDTSDDDNIIEIFSTKMEMLTPHLAGERGFLRDACVLVMTESDWSEDGINTVCAPT
jgi:hypothetical protein